MSNSRINLTRLATTRFIVVLLMAMIVPIAQAQTDISATTGDDLNPPAAGNCLTEYTGDNVTDFMSMDHTAVQQAINAATAGATVKIAGTCAGVTSNQTVLITKNITLQGGYDASAPNWTGTPDPVTYPTVLDALNGGRVVNNNNSYTVTIAGLTLQNATSTSQGGGIYNWFGTLTISDSIIRDNASGNFQPGGGIYNIGGPLTISNSTLSGNTATTGGGIYTTGTTIITNSTISGNTVSGGGGGIFSENNQLTIRNSTINGNTVTTGGGGGIYNNSGTLTISNTTISGNTVGFGGGGIFNSGPTTITHSTLSGNSGPFGSNISNPNTVTLRNTILDNPLGGGNNCDNAITDGGHNISSDTSCGFSDPDSLSNTNPLLDAAGLQNNGGPTQTIALQVGSPALDAGDNTFLLESTFSIDYNGDGDTTDTISTDQRDTGFARIVNGTVDIGAFEYAPPPVCFVEYTGDNVTDFSSADHSAVQNAINAAGAGGTVKIAGTCAGVSDQDTNSQNETVLITKNITLQGGYDASAPNWLGTPDPITYPTILDATNSGRVVDNGGGHTLNIAGLTLQNATSNDHGGGIYTVNGTVTVSNSTIRNNTVSGFNLGGGIYTFNGTLTIINSTVSDNSSNDFGGGIYNDGGTTTISNSTVSGNSATNNSGGGIYSFGSLTISNSTVSGNFATNGSGGGIFSDGGTISNSTVSGNTTLDGGGIYSFSGPLTISNSTISGNTATNGSGGGILSNGLITISNSTISGNSANFGGGGGIFVSASTTTITNSTIASNTSSNPLGSNVQRFNGTLTLRNTLLDNPLGGGVNCFGTITDGGYNISSDASCGFVAAGSLNSINPLLDAAGLQNNGGPTQTIALQMGSPAINTGDNTFLNEATFSLDYNGDGDTLDTISTDQRGSGFARVGGSAVDIGAYETPACFAEYTGDNVTDFSSADHSAVQQAINAAGAGGTVKIAGTCAGVGNQDAFSGNETVLIGKDIALQGGYDPVAQDWTITPDPTTYPTVLDAQNNGRVVYTRSGYTITIAGLTIQNGNVNGEGGGIYNSFGVLTISNSIISGNTASLGGGGILNNGSSVIISDSIISGNNASYGGGIYSTSSSSVIISNSTISGNTANSGGGGGINHFQGSVTISNSTFSGNTASFGGGILNSSGSVTISNSTISGNTANSSIGGGGILNSNGSVTISSSTISGNTATSSSGIDSNDPITLRNTILANPIGGGVNCDSPIIDGGHNISSDGSCGLSDPDSLSNTDPLLDPAGLQNNGGPTQTIALQLGSPAINAGDNTFLNEATFLLDYNGDGDTLDTISTDQRGSGFARIGGGTVDIGAYEAPACFVEYTGDNVTDFSSIDHIAVQNAVNAATAGATVKIAGICAGVSNQDSNSDNETVLITKNITLQGGYDPVAQDWTITPDPVTYPTVLDATNNGRVVDNGGGHTLVLNGLTIQNGISGGGSGIYSNGTTTITNSTFSGNNASGIGGGIYSNGLTTISNSTVSGNNANAGGGGIYSNGLTTISNSTVSGNSAIISGGGIFINNTVTIINSTIAGNIASIGSNVWNISGSMTLRNTILGNPLGGGDNCDGPIIDGGHNISSDGSCGLSDPDSLSNTDPLLDAAGLQNNGGPTQTIALQAGSPAINAGDNTFLDESTFGIDYNGDGDTLDTISTDQRGSGFARIGGGTVDIGAYEAPACFVEYTGDNVTDFSSLDHTAVQQAINAATAGATVKIAGICAGVTSSQTVLINKDITLQGGYDAANWLAISNPATYPTVLDAQNSGRVVNNSSGHTVTIDGLTIENGFTTGEGGGITNSGPLTIRNSTISGNSASLLGGGIASTGALTISNSTISGNSTSDYGGGIGGGNTLTISNSTVSGNSASNGGGGIAGFGALTLTNSTIAGNISSGGSNVRRMSGTIILRNTILDNPVGGGGNCFGTISDGGYNISSDNSCGFSAPSLNNTDPLLDPAGLQNNGGPTQTIALQAGSPAIDIARPWQCTYDHDNNGATPEQRLTFDQRGDVRHQGRGCDAGAYEYQEATITINEIDVDQSATVNGDTAEFIELYDGGVGNTPIDDLMLVFLDASPTQLYAALPSQTGMWTTDANGYFVICTNASNVSAYCDFNMQRPADWLRDEVGTLTMHPSTTISPLTFSYPFPNGFDGYAYDTNSAVNALTNVVIPAPYGQVTENGDAGSTVDSMQRCSTTTPPTPYEDIIFNNAPTPGTTNDCASPFTPPTGEPPQPPATELLPVTPVSPKNQTVETGWPTFTWQRTNDADLYHIWLIKAQPLYIWDGIFEADAVCNATQCQATAPLVLPNDTYIWSVRAYNAEQTVGSNWSVELQFTVEAQRLPQDVDRDGLVAPLDVMFVINRAANDDPAADVDGNGVVNENDAYAVYNALGNRR